MDPYAPLPSYSPVYASGQVSVSRQKSLNDVLLSVTRRERASSTTNPPSSSHTNITRKRSLSSILGRWTTSFLTSTPEPIQFSSKKTDYDIIRRIGSGASASVYSAIHLPTKTKVAIKAVDLELLDVKHDSQLEALHKEIQIMSLCNHPHLLSVYQSFVSSTHLHVVMPIMSAGSCHNLLRKHFRHGLEEQWVACILKQVAQGLEYLHQNGLVHRDIKAANILLDYDTGYVKLADFGVSNYLHPTSVEGGFSQMPPLHETPSVPVTHVTPPTLPSLSWNDTTPGTRQRSVNARSRKVACRSFVGTPCWMAPEIIHQCEYDTKVDIWSLGITALELACGTPPFSEYDPFTIFQRIMHHPPPTLKTTLDFGTEFHDFVDNCLRKNPQERFSVTKLLAHPFLHNARPPQYLSRIFLRHPEIDIRTVAMTRQQDHYARKSIDQDPFHDLGWNFSPPTSWIDQPKPTRLDTRSVAPTEQMVLSPVTPEDDIHNMTTKSEICQALNETPFPGILVSDMHHSRNVRFDHA